MERELKGMEEQKKTIDEVVEKHLNDSIKFKESLNGNVGGSDVNATGNKVEDEVIEEVCTSTTKEDIETVVASCEHEKQKRKRDIHLRGTCPSHLILHHGLSRAAELSRCNNCRRKTVRQEFISHHTVGRWWCCSKW
jgi:hypothetical protein